MVLDAMQAVQAEGVAMCDAHPDLEVFRLRLGKALNYEYNEDTQTGLFQRRDPREGKCYTARLTGTRADELRKGGPALDIERGGTSRFLYHNDVDEVCSAQQTGKGRTEACETDGEAAHHGHQQRSLLQPR